jgi:hypothetical protein
MGWLGLGRKEWGIVSDTTLERRYYTIQEVEG